MDLFNQNLELEKLTYAEVLSLAEKCQKCGLSQKRNRVVFGEGPVPANLMLIGEGPGAEEDSQGRPFVGKAGQLLTKILQAAGIKRPDDIYITNIVKCRPPENRTPLPEEIEKCYDYLKYQIKKVAPKIIILAGSPAASAVLIIKEPISKIRGHWFKIEGSIFCLPIFHPSFLLRNPSKQKGSPRWLTYEDTQEIKNALNYFKTLEKNEN